MINIFDTEIGQAVYATELYDYLGLEKSHYSRFIKKEVTSNPYCDEKSYLPYRANEKKHGRFRQEYYIHIDFAKKLCMVSRSPKANEIRNELVELTKQVENHKLLDAKKAAFAYVLINTFQFAEHQIEAEQLHKDKFRLSNKFAKNIHEAFAEYRNDYLSINNNQLKQDLITAFNQGKIPVAKGKNIRHRIYLLDKYKLIRDAVAELLVSKGVNTIEAINFADTVRNVAELANVEIRMKNENTLFDNKRNDVVLPREISTQNLLNS
jgi:phage anti-repressor protein